LTFEALSSINGERQFLRDKIQHEEEMIMLTQPQDSEADELEVRFDSCVWLKVICHKDVFQQLVDGANAPTRPSPTKGANYVEFGLQIADTTKQRINWAYTPDPDTTQDHGQLLIDVITAPGVPNPLSQLRAEIRELRAELASKP
jgi:hypothetical protein